MNKKVILKRVGQILLLFILLSMIILYWADRQLYKYRGGFTEVIEAPGKQHQYSDLIIRHAHILAPDCSHFLTGYQVVLKNGSIVAVEPDSISRQGMKVLDAQGQFLIPGLVDSHVHLKASKNDLYLYLANGVTYVREMAGNPTHLTWREEITQGTMGPQVFVASEKVNSNPGMAGLYDSWTRNRINFTSEEAAKKKIAQLKSQGFDAIKISTHLNAEMYEATLKYAQEQGLPVIGHIPVAVGLNKALYGGQKEYAHVEEITKSKMWEYGRIGSDNASEFLAWLERQSDSLARLIREEDIAVTSTIWLMESLPKQKFELPSTIRQIKLAFANPGQIEGTLFARGWLPGNNYYMESEEVTNNPKRAKASREFWETYVKAIHIMTAALARNGVQLMAGTDACGALTIPGFSLHDELVSLSQAGMTPAQVLFSATVAPGKWMKTKTGIIQEGYQADLVLLSQNPLEDIQHTRSIESVFRGGYWLQKSHLQDLLEAVKKANDEARTVDISPFQ
ncbi:MAG: amidohydrolase family protein [Bacteroidota bacterium]